jgi:hypothetical protein
VFIQHRTELQTPKFSLDQQHPLRFGGVRSQGVHGSLFNCSRKRWYRPVDLGREQQCFIAKIGDTSALKTMSQRTIARMLTSKLKVKIRLK